MGEKHYIGKINILDGERTYTSTIRFTTAGDPAEYLEEVASEWFGDSTEHGRDSDEKVDGGWYFLSGQVHVSAANYKEIPAEVFNGLDGIVTHL